MTTSLTAAKRSSRSRPGLIHQVKGDVQLIDVEGVEPSAAVPRLVAGVAVGVVEVDVPARGGHRAALDVVKA